MDAYESINKILVHLFNDIWELEEKAVITEEFKDLTNNDMHIIEAIGLGTGNNMSTIAKKLGITVGSLTTSMNSLVNKKYAVRHRSEEDRRIVKNKCLNHLRSQGVRLRAAEDIHSHGARMLRTRISTLEACNPEELFSEEARRLVNETLDRLPEKTRAIFIRSRFDGKSYKEIAAEMGVTVKSVEFEVSKAMKILRVVLKDYLAYFIFWFYIN